MRVQDREVTFNVFKAMKFPKESDEFFMVDILDEYVDNKMSVAYFFNPLENTIVNSACGERRMLQLNEMDEFHLQAYENAKLDKDKTKR